jgi:hypothetical protein
MHQTGRHPCVLLGKTLLALLFAGVGQADDEKTPDDVVSDSPPSIVATNPAAKPLDLLLTREELQSIVRKYYEIGTGRTLTSSIDDDDEVIVTGTRELAPMRDASQDAWGGIAAPFWAIMNPKDAWRIFVPVPPKGRPKEEESPAPDPR